MREARCQRLPHPAQSLESLAQVSREGPVNQRLLGMLLAMWCFTCRRALSPLVPLVCWALRRSAPLLNVCTVICSDGQVRLAGGSRSSTVVLLLETELELWQSCDRWISPRREDTRAGCQVGSALCDRWLGSSSHTSQVGGKCRFCLVFVCMSIQEFCLCSQSGLDCV